MSDEHDLTRRWSRLLPGVPELGAELIAAYADPTRRYHNLVHLSAVLEAIDSLMPTEAGTGLIQLAAWFHDAVYDVHAPDNEERSASWAETALRSAALPHADIDEVARLVRLTATHDPGPHDDAGAVLCDADLAILASEPDTYRAYRQAIREEYAHVSDDDFRRGRRAILERLLDLPSLFRTPLGTARWEAHARANVEAELADLADPQTGVGPPA